MGLRVKKTFSNLLEQEESDTGQISDGSWLSFEIALVSIVIVLRLANELVAYITVEHYCPLSSIRL